MMTATALPPGSGAAPGPLVPVLPMQDGPPDAVGVAAWHLALSNLIGQEVPHDLLGMWLFPDRGGVMLLAPAELGRDRLDFSAPAPFLSQYQIFLLEERIRQAGYRSVLAIPIRDHGRDLGLAIFAHLEAGRYGPTQALRLVSLMRQVVPTFALLAESPPLALAAGPAINVTHHNVAEVVARAAAEARTPSEMLRLVSGALQPLLPHERIEVAVPGLMRGSWALLSAGAENHRWGEVPAGVSAAVNGLISRAAADGSLMVGNLRSLQLTWPAYRETRALLRVQAVLGIRLAVAGGEEAWLLLGGAAPDGFRETDRELLRVLAPVIALRVHGLRMALEAEVTRAQLASRPGQNRAGRLAAAFAGTPQWSEAMGYFVDDLRESLGFAEVRFALRWSDDGFVEFPAGDPRPLALLPVHPLPGSALEPLFEATVPHLLLGAEDCNLALPLRVAGRVIGALELLQGPSTQAEQLVSSAQLFADLVAPHLELVRRAALARR